MASAASANPYDDDHNILDDDFLDDGTSLPEIKEYLNFTNLPHQTSNQMSPLCPTEHH